MSKFINVRRGEIAELKNELNSPKLEKRREAIKRVIAVMTVGKDVSSLFMDVLKCVGNSNLEMKKLVYLYIINYAKTQPELTLMAVNTFRKDSRDKTNPLIRALAVRTMGCIGVESIVEYLAGPLKDALDDQDPYVRKTAAVTVAKMYEIKEQTVEDMDLIGKLLKMAQADGNPMVVANAVAALNEISNTKGPLITMNPSLQSQLLNSLNDCSEWCKIYILDALATYLPNTTKDAATTIERIQGNMSSSNPAVVLSAVKVIIRYLDFITDPETVRKLCRKLAQPLVSLMSSEPEVQYVALRNINIIIQKRPKILEGEVRFFFCNYADPVYVKNAKLEILIRLVDPTNIDQVLHELRDYAQEVDVQFVKKAVQAIGRCAIKMEKIAERCVHVLLELIRTKVDLVVQEAIVVIRDIFRKYPNKYETIIRDICANLKTLDSVEAKSAMVWIIGEYAERIDNSPELIDKFIVNFKDEPSEVQIQILTAAVKLYLKREDEVQDLVIDLLNVATQEVDNPDLRERAYIYWRLLASHKDNSKDLILSDKPTISEDSQALEPQLLDRLIENISLLSSVYYQTPETFVEKIREKENERYDLEHIDDDEEDEQEDIEMDSSGQKKEAVEAEGEFQGYVMDGADDEEAKGAEPDSNLLDMDDEANLDLPPLMCTVPMKPVAITNNVTPQLQIQAAFQRKQNKISLELKLQNTGSRAGGFALQFNKNIYGLTPTETFSSEFAIESGQTVDFSLQVAAGTNYLPGQVNIIPFVIMTAIRTSNEVLYFNIPILLCVVFKANDKPAQAFGEIWSEIPIAPNMYYQIKNVNPELANFENLKQRLGNYNVTHLNSSQNQKGENAHYFGIITEKNEIISVEVVLPSPQIATLCVKCKDKNLIPLVHQSMHFLFSSPSC